MNLSYEVKLIIFPLFLFLQTRRIVQQGELGLTPWQCCWASSRVKGIDKATLVSEALYTVVFFSDALLDCSLDCPPSYWEESGRRYKASHLPKTAIHFPAFPHLVTVRKGKQPCKLPGLNSSHLPLLAPLYLPHWALCTLQTWDDPFEWRNLNSNCLNSCKCYNVFSIDPLFPILVPLDVVCQNLYQSHLSIRCMICNMWEHKYLILN